MTDEPNRLGCCWPNDANVKMLGDDCELVMVDKPCANTEGPDACTPLEANCWACNARQRKAHGPYAPPQGDANGKLTAPLSEPEKALAYVERRIEQLRIRAVRAQYEAERLEQLAEAMKKALRPGGAV